MSSLGTVDTSANRPPTHVGDVLDRLQRDPGRPRLTWYGEDGERIELSGAVLVNWVNKTTNLLVEEFDAAPGTRVLLDLPGHWRTLVWALATWRAGACVVRPDGPAAVDTVVTCHPGQHADAPEVVAVALPALARAWPGDLPGGAVDAAAAVMTYADALGPTPPTDPASPALDDGRGTGPLRHADLLGPVAGTPAGAGTSGTGRGDRALLTAAEPVGPLLLRALAVWASDGSVVLVAPAVAQDRARLERLIADERVDAPLG